MSTPQEHDYIGLSSSPSSEVVAAASSMKKTTPAAASLNLKETELRLGLPGSASPDRNNNNNTNSSLGLFPFFGKNQNFVVSGAKRGFDDSSCERWGYADLNSAGSDDDHHVDSKKLPPAVAVKEVADLEKKKVLINEHGNNAPAAKAQVVGWPPVRSFRKNTMATSLAKNNDEAECLYVKVSMDGAPYLRKVDLKTYSNYMELSSALEKMFSCFTIGQCGSHGNGMSESRLVDLLHGSESVLTYEDKDGDWMLVGDVPWQMFANSCRRLRIMKGSEAIGLAPRAMEKCKNRN